MSLPHRVICVLFYRTPIIRNGLRKWNGTQRRRSAEFYFYQTQRHGDTEFIFERTEFSKLSLRVFVSLCSIFSQTNLLLKKQK